MAGLIKNQMQGGAPAQPQDPAQQAPEEMMDSPEMEAGEDEGADEDSDPGFQQALTFAYEALYKGEAAKDVAKQLRAAPSIAEGMADVAYNITQIVDEKTQGAVPDELLAVLGMRILEEVAEIAEAANAQPTPEDVAASFKTMILRFLGEQGVDTTQLQQAMDQVDPAVFRQAAEQA